MFAFFFFNDTATTEIYTLSLPDALPISHACDIGRIRAAEAEGLGWPEGAVVDPAIRRMDGALHSSEPRLRVRLHQGDRKSTRLNSSHSQISYAVFCLTNTSTSTS